MEYEQVRLILEKYGLSQNEAKAYLTLLRLGGSMAGKISKEAQIDRASCYDALKKLLKKGLASYALQANRKMFKAVSPDRLIEILKEKQEEIEKILPELKAIHKKEKENYNVTLYKGYKGLKSVFDNILHEAKGRENLVIDSSGEFSKRMPYYIPHFKKGLEKNNIKVRHIVRRGAPNLNPSKTTNLRFLSKKVKETIVTTNVYNDKIAIILWTDVPEAIVIENKAAADSYRDYFEIIWKAAQKG